jgi:hypothetical protein
MDKKAGLTTIRSLESSAFDAKTTMSRIPREEETLTASLSRFGSARDGAHSGL